MAPMKTKLFTVEEANQMLPQVSAFIDELAALKIDIEKRQAEIDVLELVGVASSQVAGKLRELEGRVENFRDRVRRFHGLGCELKDLEAGLVDFLAHQGDQLVYLCWKRGEPKVGHWHPIEGGYATRKPL